MGVFERLKIRAKNTKQEISAIFYACQHPETPTLPKIIILFTLGYALSPIDLFPDFIPILGYLDDILVIPALIAISIKLIPAEIMEFSRKKAEGEPVTLKENWLFAGIFIAIWVVLLVIIVYSIVY